MYRDSPRKATRLDFKVLCSNRRIPRPDSGSLADPIIQASDHNPRISAVASTNRLPNRTTRQPYRIAAIFSHGQALMPLPPVPAPRHPLDRAAHNVQLALGTPGPPHYSSGKTAPLLSQGYPWRYTHEPALNRQTSPSFSAPLMAIRRPRTTVTARSPDNPMSTLKGR